MNYNYREKIFSEKGYYITEDGQAFSSKNKLKHCLNRDGYIIISCRYNGKMIQIDAHRLQPYQKYGDKIYENGIEVRHSNGNKNDISYNNIVIGTHSENMMDQPLEDRLKYAINATQSAKVYSDETCVNIRIFHDKYKSYKLTMEEFGISNKGTLWFILNKRIR